MIAQDLDLLKFNTLVDDANEVLFKYLYENNPYCLEISNVYENANQELINILVNSFAEDIYSSMVRTINDPRVISYLRGEVSTSGYTFDIDEFFKIVFNEYIKLTTEFKQKKGLDIAIEYIYNMVMSSGLQPNVGGSDVPFELTWGSVGNPNEPFSFQVRGFLLPFIYDNVVKEIAHPLGFGYSYQRSLTLNFIDYVNDNVFNVYNTIQVKGIEQGQEVVYDFSQFADHVIDYSLIENQDGTSVETIKFINNGKIETIEKKADNRIVYYNDTGVLKEWDNSFSLIIKYEQKSDFRVLDSFSANMKMNYYDFATSPNKKITHRIGEAKLVIGKHWQINNSYRIKEFPSSPDTAFLKFFLSNNRDYVIPYNGRLIFNLDCQSFVTNKFIDGDMSYCQYNLFNDNTQIYKIAPSIQPEETILNGFGKWIVDGSNNNLYISKNENLLNIRAKDNTNIKLFKENGRGSIYLVIDDKNAQEEGLIFILDNDIQLGLSYNPATQKYSLKNYGNVGGSIDIESDASYSGIEKRIVIIIGRNDNQVNNLDVRFYINETLIGSSTLTQPNSEVDKIRFNTSLTQSSFCDLKINAIRIWEGVALLEKDLTMLKKFDTNPLIYNHDNIDDINNYINEASIRGLYQGVGENFSIEVRRTIP